MTDTDYNPNVMEINVSNFLHNVEEIKKLISNNIEIMPVMKANAYGTYLNTLTNLLNRFNIIGVANTFEGAMLRKNGYTKEIFVLNQPNVSEIENIINNDLTIGLSSNDFLKEAQKVEHEIKVHIEIGTGMGRTGINPSRVHEFVKKVLLNKHLKIEGIYTHLSSADTDYEYTNNQLESFEYAVNEIKKLIPNIKFIHAAASNGIVNFPKSHFNLVRPGLALYGYKGFMDEENLINLKPVATLSSKINYIKTVPKNYSIGYGRKFITQRETTVATIPIGYADGIRRNLSNDWYVFVGGQKAPIIGNICMDSFMIDITDLKNIKINDPVYIWDNENITIEDIAHKLDTINYEILASISPRVGRIFINKLD